MSKEFIKKIIDLIELTDLYKLEGFDNCIIGFDLSSNKLIYCQNKIISEIAKNSNYDEAVDFYYYNVADCVTDKIIICSTLDI